MADLREDFKSLLRKNGLKATPQRVAILELLNGRPDHHLTAEEIYECVRDHYPEIGLATVYRTILVLSELHLIDKLNLDEGCVRYEIGKKNGQTSVHHHHHLICLECGQVYTVQEDLLDALEQKIEETIDFHVTDHEVKLYGTCSRCNEKRLSMKQKDRSEIDS